MSNDTGGQAFPVAGYKWNDDTHEYEPSGTEPGMTLRDYFAAKAMQGDLAAMQEPDRGVCCVDLDASDDELYWLARHYYRRADAMLKARNG